MSSGNNDRFEWAVRTLDRQQHVCWGPNYKAAIRKSKQESPSGGWSSADYSTKLQRQLFAHGFGTRSLLALALYHPCVFEVHDEHILYPGSSMHPLASHPQYKHQPWPKTRGTIEIAESIGKGHMHPAVFVRSDDVDSAGEAVIGMWQVLPYVGDYLLYLTDEHGAYAIAWDVKAKSGDHAKPWGGDFRRFHGKRANDAANFRDEVYQNYLSELDIRLVRMAGNAIDKQLASHLVRMLTIHSRPAEVDATIHAEIIAAFAEALKSGTPPINVICQYMSKNIPSGLTKDLLDHAIWGRNIRVDLFSEISIDRPLVPEKNDPIEVYAKFFRRTA